MRGNIFVTSEVGVGSKYVNAPWADFRCLIISRFTCQIPAEISAQPSSKLAKQLDELAALRQALLEPVATRVVAYSPYPSTRSLLNTALQGLRTNILTTLEEVKGMLKNLQDIVPTRMASVHYLHTVPEVIVLDVTHSELDDVCKIMVNTSALRLTRVVQLYVRTAETLHYSTLNDDIAPERAVLRCPKPFRPLPLLRLLVQARAETPLVTPIALPSSGPPIDLLPTLSASLATVNGNGIVSTAAAGPIRKTASAPPPTRLGKPTAKLADNFTPRQLDFLKTVHILIAEGTLLLLLDCCTTLKFTLRR